MKVFEDLERRGLVKQVTDREKVCALLEAEEAQTFYLGVDPTADSLHVGHLLPLVTAKRLMDAGHKALILIGTATASIGDPSGKSHARPMMDTTTIEENAWAIKEQIARILKIDLNKFDTFVDNLSWFEGEMFLEFLREVGPHFSVNNMLRAECFKSRLETGLSFLEFNYMIMQAFDFLILHNCKDHCRLQIGGDDQWSNMLAGIDLIHKKTGAEAFALTLPLLVNSDGTKMGKTERGTVWLDANKTSPFDFFQFWRNIPDDKVRECVNMFTPIDPSTFDKQFDNINEAKKFLAVTVTTLVHGWETAQQALEQAEALFEKKDTSVANTIQVSEGSHILDAIIKCGFAKSRTDARNLILNRGITINEEVQTNPTLIISKDIFGNDLILKKGKKHFCRLLIEDKCPDQNT